MYQPVGHSRNSWRSTVKWLCQVLPASPGVASRDHLLSFRVTHCHGALCWSWEARRRQQHGSTRAGPEGDALAAVPLHRVTQQGQV